MNQPTPTAFAQPLNLRWQSGFSALGSDFFTELRPTPLPSPHWVGTSTDVAQLLSLSAPEMAVLVAGLRVLGANH
eukprot:gene35648-biopygen30317